MVRETRHLWVGNLPDNIREDRIREHFKRYGRVQSVKLLSRSAKEETGENTTACTVAFMDIKSASKAHTAEHKIDDKTLTTEYYEPAAIPSTASPQNTNSAYSTSPGSTRFTNNHGTPDEHGNFNDRFYDRTNSRVVADSEYIRRQNYHDGRSRNRDRSFRNGPYNNVGERHRSLNSSWSYDSSRGYNSETGYGTPTDTNDKRSSDSQSTTTNSNKKKTKSPSESRSVSPSGSNTSRSPSRSRSQSSSSSSSSTTSQETSSTSSRKSRRKAASSNSSHQPVVHSDDRRPLAICVKNLPLRSSDTSLKDGLFHEYKKHGKVTWVKIVGQGSDRHAIVCFKKPEDVDKAIEVSYDKLFFGCKIEVAPYQGYDVDDNELRPYEAEIDEFHPKATRTLFIGNLEKDFTASDLRKHFDQFGEIIEIDIKKQGAVTSYAFCQYSDIISVVKAIRAMDGEHLGNNRIKLGFGKSMPTNCVWVDGVVDSVTDKYLTMQFDSFGPISQVIIDRDKGQALIFYEQVANAQVAVTKMRGVTLRGRKVQVDFASRECQESFYEHLEKQGHVTDRQQNFDEKRDTVSSVTSTPRYTARYETPRARSTSYNANRTSASTGQCNTPSLLHSPGTPGSVTPRGTGSRSRLRITDYYDQVSVNSVDYVDRRFRSYDEYSQSSAASHEEVFEHDNRESPIRIDHNDHVLTTAFPPPEMRNLQKERFHLLEQLDDYNSSGDELVNPKKRIKLELDNSLGSDVIIEANRDHRKVMEVRRTSDGSLKHYSRRPSVDNNKHAYLPHAVCKRRKTGGSDSSSRVQHHELSGSESVESSRPGTPLCDERPENLPTEPRRVPREREGPLSLPLPRFAAQVMGKGSVSVAGIKGQKDNVLSSPPPAVTSPRISNPPTPGVIHVPPPASPPPRPPSPSSNSSDSDLTAPSPSLDERIKSLDEKYEKWSGSRSVSAAGSEALAKLDASASERFRFSYKLLDLDLKELQPSEIVKSVLAKPSVFDEDLKRLENVNEKYDFNLFMKTTTTVTPSTTTAPLPSSPVKVSTTTAHLPKSSITLSPRSSGANLPTAKGLQYPFPSHPPIQPATVTPPPPSATTRSSHGENRLKPCVSATSASDTRTSATNNKVVLNRTGSNNSSLGKTSESTNSNKNNCNISDTNITDINAKQTKSVRDKSGEKVAHRRDSTNSCELSRSEIKSRRNSENSGRKSDSNDKQSDNICDTSAYEEKRKTCEDKSKVEEEKRKTNEERRKEEKRKLEEVKQKTEEDKWINEDKQKEEEKRKLEDEKKRLELEKLEQEHLEKLRLEKERQEKLERERLERLEKERAERLERERLERERLEKERLNKERLEKERLEKERLEQEHKREREEKDRKEREEKEKKEREDKERREQEEQERLDRERKERKEKEDKERREREEREKREKEEKERKREEERKHKDDNHEKHQRHHSDNKHHKDSSGNDNSRNDKCTKDKTKENFDSNRKDLHESHNKSSHEKHHHNNEKTKHHSHHGDSREVEKRKESTKENRENNLHDKIVNEIKEHHKIIESRHISIDLDRHKTDSSRRRDRNNSLPVSIGSKRRMSLQDTLDVPDESKRIKLNHEHRKLSERRDSKDSIRSEEKIKTKHKNNIAKIIEDKIRNEKLNSVKEVTTEDKRKEDKYKHKQKVEKQKSKDKAREKEVLILKSPSILIEREFLARLDLQATEDVEKARQRKESKDKLEEVKKTEEYKKDKRSSSERRSREEITSPPTKKDESKLMKKERTRKVTHSSDAATDSDEPKKQSRSIFDIVDDEPAYISMYDKVKARSCKNMQKQEEEKRQEQIKAKFNQLKQSRAKREEKKRSTSWDEDSDSEHDRRSGKTDSNKSRKSSKMLIMSSDEESNIQNRHRKKKDISSDSDCDKIRLNHESSDEENKTNSCLRNTGGFIDDDFKRMQDKIKAEIFSDSSELDQRFIDLEEKVHKKIKDEDIKHTKKEGRKKKRSHHLSADEIKSQIFGDSPLPEIKSEDVFDNGQLFGDASSGDDNHDNKKDMRKRHKKKTKRQKYSITSEEDSKLELTVELIKDENIDRMKNSERKKQHGKKDKKKDKVKDEHKEKNKKSKRPKTEIKSDSRRDGKMENIFGSFSEESDNEKEQDQTYREQYIDAKPRMYVSDSDSISHIEKEIQRTEEKERREKRKERKRLEKEKRLREEENENSMDYADLGKQLEDNIKDDSNDIIETIKSDGDERNEDVLHFTVDDSLEIKDTEKKEKKKKRKKSKEEKHKHHHHHHDKTKISNSPDTDDREFNFSINEPEKPLMQSVSLPNLLDLPSPPLLSSNKTENVMKKRDIFIPEFGVELDETAVKSISEEFESIKPKLEIACEIKQEEIKLEKPDVSDDKPRVIISQEETEDAVAALLGESFGNNSYPRCYSHDPRSSIISSEHVAAPDETVPEDLEEMRQAVQNLNSGELEIKPETPQSEHELQIDTDTEETEDGLRFDQSPRTSDTVDLSRPPKTPDIPSYFGPEEQTKTIVIKATITSPPSLTPLKSSTPLITDVKKVDIHENTKGALQATSEALPRSYSIPIKITEQVKKELPESVTVKPYTLTLHMQQQQQKISFNRLPITPIMMSKPFHQSTVSLPQPKVAQTSDACSPSGKEQLHSQSRVIFQGHPSQVPQFLLNSQNSQARMIVQNMQLPRAIIRPSGTFTGLPSKPYMNQMTSSEPPKLVPTSHPLPVMSEPSQVGIPEAPTLASLSTPTVIQPSIVQSTVIKPTLVITTTPVSQQVIREDLHVEKASPSLPITEEFIKQEASQEDHVLERPQESPIISSLSPQSPPSNIGVMPPEQPVSTLPIEISPPPQIPIQTQTLPQMTLLTPPQTPSKLQSDVPHQVQPVSLQVPQQLCSEIIQPLEPKLHSLPEPKLAIEQVTDELNLSLKKVEDIAPIIPSVQNSQSEVMPIVQELSSDNEDLGTIRNNEKVDDDKGETESIESDISKERLSVDLTTKDDGLDSKEDSDYWSAKEVNIDSVIKKVDALCSADELSDRSSEISKDDWLDVKTEVPLEVKIDEPITNFSDVPEQTGVRGGRRTGRARGRKMRGGILTRRAKASKDAEINSNPTSPSKRGGRTPRTKVDFNIEKPEMGSSDVYEFRDESDENKDRPRLILTIKSPVVPVVPNNGNVQASAVKEVPKEVISPAKVEAKEDFVSPTNTRKSRRLQERGGEPGKTSIDDTIEDVIRNNNVMVTRSAAAAQTTATRRLTRQTIKSVIDNSPRKSPRSARKKDRRTSDTTDDSSEEKSIKSVEEEPLKISKPVTEPLEESKDSTLDDKDELPKEKPHEGLKAAVLRRIKGELNIQEPMTLIDPVTGVLIPMRECEEGRYIPVGLVNALANQGQLIKPLVTSSNQIVTPEMLSIQTSVDMPVQTVATTSASVIHIQKPPQSLKAHVLSSHAKRVIITPTQSQSEPSPKVVTLTVTPPVSSQPGIVIKANVPITQHLNVNVPTSNVQPANVSPRPYILPNVSKPAVQTLPPVMKIAQQPSVAKQIITHVGHPKQQQQISKPVLSKPHLSVPVSSNVINSQLAHLKHAMPQVQVIKPHSLHSQQQVLTASVASPPLKQAHHGNQQPIIGASSTRLNQISATVPNISAKNSMEPPPKVDVSMAGCVLVPHPISSPQGQTRLPLQTGLPMSSYEGNLGDTMTHFQPGSVKLRPSHDLISAHYIHPHMYQQYLRQSYHLPRSPLVVGNLEKSSDGQEGEEAPVELRRPGSVGLALTGRTPVVPHSLQSPHDRSTDSPQVGQVYIHNSRLPHYHPNRYFDQTEPPPAHRPLTSHTSLAGLGNDRPIGHITNLGTPDRPLSSHLIPERPLSTHSALGSSHMGSSGATHLPPDRPLSGHSFQLGTGLGAAGNLMGAVARHIGETPASQRGLQAATPPHASQVPPHAESLVILLKQFPCMWQGLLALKNDQAAVQMYFVSGNDEVAKCSLPKNIDGSTPPLRIFQRMRLEPPQVEGVARKMQMENEHCMLLALPCGHDHMDVLKQSTNLTNGFITYLQQKQAAGIVNVAAPGTTQPPAYVVHIFPSCDFVNENLRRFAPTLLERVSDIAHLLIVITTV